MSGRRFTLDTNILVYAVDNSAGRRHLVAAAVVARAAVRDCRLTLQAVAEFYAAVTRKGIVPARDAAMIAADWMELFPCAATSAEAVRLALDAAATGRVAYWDALLVACAAEGGVRGGADRGSRGRGALFGVRIVNPFEPGGVAAAGGAGRAGDVSALSPRAGGPSARRRGRPTQLMPPAEAAAEPIFGQAARDVWDKTKIGRTPTFR